MVGPESSEGGGIEFIRCSMEQRLNGSGRLLSQVRFLNANDGEPEADPFPDEGMDALSALGARRGHPVHIPCGQAQTGGKPARWRVVSTPHQGVGEPGGGLAGEEEGAARGGRPEAARGLAGELVGGAGVVGGTK